MPHPFLTDYNKSASPLLLAEWGEEGRLETRLESL